MHMHDYETEGYVHMRYYGTAGYVYTRHLRYMLQKALESAYSRISRAFRLDSARCFQLATFNREG